MKNADSVENPKTLTACTISSHPSKTAKGGAASIMIEAKHKHRVGQPARFMTPDWAAKPVTVPYASFGNPQSLNLYTYVENNPTTTGDPDGHADWYDTSGRRQGTDGVNDGGVVIQKASAVSYSSDHSLVDVAGSGTPVASRPW